MTKKTKKVAEQVQEFLDAVKESKREQEETNKVLTEEEEEKKRQEMISEAWNSLSQNDQYLCSTCIQLRNITTGLFPAMTQQGRDFLALIVQQ